MGLQAYVEKLESVPEALRGFYTKTDDGKYRLDAEGVEDTAGLRSALNKERDNAKAAEKSAKEARDAQEAFAKQFEGIDPEQVKALWSKMGGDEEMKLIKEGKFDQVFEKRTANLRKDFERQLKAAQDAAAVQITEATTKAQKYAQGLLDNRIREAATKVGIHSHAVDDALLRGRVLFSLDDEGNAVQSKDGALVYGKDGKSPYSPQEWLEGMRESAPHWFPATAAGGGAPASRSNGAIGKKTTTRAAFDAMDATQRMSFIKEQGTVAD